MTSSKMQGDLWSERASDWAEFQEKVNFPLFEAMLNATLVRKGTHFIDIGCGSGGSSALAARRGANITGIDVASGLLDIAKSRLPFGDFRVCDMEDLPFEDDSFDVVFAANSIQFADDSSRAVREFKRVCRPKGYIILGLFSTPDTVESAAILKDAVTSLISEPIASKSPFELSSRDKLEALFASANLDILTRQVVNCPFIYPDVETYLKGFISSGLMAALIRKIDIETVKQALLKVAQDMITEEGEVRIEQNHMQYVVAKKK